MQDIVYVSNMPKPLVCNKFINVLILNLCCWFFSFSEGYVAVVFFFYFIFLFFNKIEF